MSRGDSSHFSKIAMWLQTFVPLGDGIRRVMVHSVVAAAGDGAIFELLGRATELNAKVLVNFLGSLTNDTCFSVEFARIVIINYTHLMQTIIVQVQLIAQVQHRLANPQEPPLVGILTFLRTCFHYFTHETLECLIRQNRLDWDRIYLDLVGQQIAFFAGGGDWSSMSNGGEVFWNHWYLSRLFKSAGKIPEQADRYRAFLKKFAQLLLRIEGVPKVRREIGEARDPRQLFLANFWFSVQIRPPNTHLAAGVPFHRPVFDLFLDWLEQKILTGRYDSTPGDPLNASVISNVAHFSPMMNIHVLCYEMLKRSNDPKAVLMDIAKSRGMKFDTICQAAALLPIRWLTATLLNSSHLLSDIPQATSESLWISISSPAYIKPCVSIFTLVQFYLSLCEDKDAFFSMLAHIFGLFDVLPSQTTVSLETLFANFVSALLCDRVVVEGKKGVVWLANAVMAWLKAGDIPTDSLAQFVHPFSTGDGPLGHILKPVVKVQENRITLSDDTKWHIAQTWMSPRLIDSFRTILSEDKHILLPFPEWVDCKELNMSAALNSRFLWAWLYDLLFHMLTRPSLAMHYALNLFIICANKSVGHHFPESIPVVAAESLSELADAIGDNFQEFIRTPVYYHHGVPNTLVQLIEKFGDVGIRVLVHANIGWSRHHNRPDMRAFKATILEQFERRKQQFEQSFIGTTAIGYCSICCSGTDSSLRVFPCIGFVTSIPSYISTKQLGGAQDSFKITKQVWSCPHACHFRCIPGDWNWSSTFQCAVCQSQRNCVLPIFGKDLAEFADPVAVEIAGRFCQFLLQDAIMTCDLMEVLAKHILVLQARATLAPEVLLDEHLKDVYRSLFLTILLSSTRRGMVDTSKLITHPLNTLVAAVVKYLLRSPRQRVDNAKLVELSNPSAFSGPIMLDYLRQAVLFGYFMLGMDFNVMDNVVDWDYLLAPRQIARLFRVKESVLMKCRSPIIRPISLPDDWVELLIEPYNLDIENFNEVRMICLLTGRLLSPNQFQLDTKLMDMLEYIDNKWQGGPIFILQLTGGEATRAVFVSREFGTYIDPDPVWVDKQGIPGIGLASGKYLMLDRNALDTAFDEFLSGKYHDALRSI
jgi:hypothetical protein